MNNRNLITKLLCFILCISISSLCEDVICLKNGGKLRGKIVKETKTGVVIDVGFGEMDVDTSEIDRIQWADKAEKDIWGEEALKAEPKKEPEVKPEVEAKVPPKVVPEVVPKVIPKSEPKIEPKVEPEVEPKIEPKVEPKVEPEVEPKIEPKVEPKVEPEVEPKVEPKIEPKVEPVAVPTIEPKVEPTIEPKLKPKMESGIEPKVEQREERRKKSRKSRRKKHAKLDYNMKQHTVFEYMSAKKGIFVIGNATLNKNLLAASTIPKNKFENIPEKVEIGIYYPEFFSKEKKYPLLIAMGPGVEIGISEINSYVQFADELGFIIAAPELPPNADVEEARYYYILHIIEYLKEVGVIVDKPVWIGGVSGGGQWALQLGAYGGKTFNGIISIGRIEDFTIITDGELKDTSLLDVPICLLNKKDDNVADAGNERDKKTIASIKEIGFTRIKVIEHGGEKVIPYKETLEALQWLISNGQ